MKSSTVETCANWLQCLQHGKSGARCLDLLKMTKHRSNFTWISLIKIATKYIHFFNLLTKTKNEELEHNLPSRQTPHLMPHPPQPQSSTDFAKPEPSSKIETVMKILQWNQHSSSHTGTSKKVGYMWHHKQMQLETTHGSLHRPRVLAPLASMSIAATAMRPKIKTCHLQQIVSCPGTFEKHPQLCARILCKYTFAADSQ